MDVATSVPNIPQSTLWSSIREAIRGSHQDYTTGNLNRAILLLAIPMVLEMVLESLFAVVDVFFVGRLGADAVATVGLTESLLSLVFAVAIGLSMSITAMVARRIGEKDPEDASIAGVQAVILGLTVSLAVGIPSFIFAPRLLQLMGASPDIVVTGSGYARIALGGSGAIQGFYEEYLGRPSDPGGVGYWIGRMSQGTTFEQVRLAFIGSPEYFALHNDDPGKTVERNRQVDAEAARCGSPQSGQMRPASKRRAQIGG